MLIKFAPLFAKWTIFDGLVQTTVTPLLTHWSYCSLALSHRFVYFIAVALSESNMLIKSAPLFAKWTIVDGLVQNFI